MIVPDPVYLYIVFPGRELVSIVGDPVVAVTVAFGVPALPDVNGKPVSNGLIFSPYANFVAPPARTVYVGVAAVFMIVNE